MKLGHQTIRNVQQIWILLLVAVLAVPVPRNCVCSDNICLCGCATEVTGRCCSAGQSVEGSGLKCRCHFDLAAASSPGCCSSPFENDSHPASKTCQASHCGSQDCQCECGLPVVAKTLPAVTEVKVSAVDVDSELGLISSSLRHAADRKSSVLQSKKIESAAKTPNVRLAELCRWLI